MSKSIKRKIKKARKPKSKLRFAELLGKHSIVQLAKHMGVTYTQLYSYKKAGANPTLLALEQIADGLSKVTGRKVSVLDLIDIPKG